MGLKKINIIGIIFGLIILAAGIIFFLNKEDINLLFFLIGISLLVILLPFIMQLMIRSRNYQETSEMFLEFSRNLAESVATGTPISKSIINMRGKNYGSLTANVQKLSNQIEIGIPVNRALETFANDVNNPVISRAVALINEAERAGGEIDYILESTAKSIAEIEKLKKERKAAIYNLVVQGYIIFFIFIGIMLVMEFKILPLVYGAGSFASLSNLGSIGSGSLTDVTMASNNITPEMLARPLLYLLLTQGLFAGLVIGKLTEGSIKLGIKHSFILMITAFIVSTGAKLFLG